MPTQRILADSACDLSPDYLASEGIELEIIPFYIHTDEREFCDTPDLDVDAMMEYLSESGAQAQSACPSPDTYYQAMMKSDISWVVTISSGLSGSYNSACIARDMAQEQGKTVYVIDSKATGGVQVLIIDALAKMIGQGLAPDEIYRRIQTFTDNRKLLFVLRNFDNLIRNGRMLKIVAKVITALNICPICAKSEQGTIEIREKIVGIKKTLRRLVTLLGENIRDFAGADVIINHCQAQQDAEALKTQIQSTFPSIGNVRIIPTRGLASFYAQRNGLIVSF